MAHHDSTTGELVKWGVIGLAAYWVYTTFFAAAAAPASSASATATGAASTTTPTPAAPAAPVAPSYTGPSLDSMYSALQNAVMAMFGSDSSLTCASTAGMSGLAAAPGSRNRPVQIRPVIVQPGGTVQSVGSGVAPARCPAASIQATCDVFNWYLLKAVPSIKTAPNCPDHTSQFTLAQYWQWAAPVLQAQIPGLSGIGPRGLGAVWGAMR